MVVGEAKWASESFWGKSQGNWIVLFWINIQDHLVVFSCREPRYPDFIDIEEMLLREGKMRRDQRGTYMTSNSPVHDFIEECGRGVLWSETSPPRPFLVNWRLRKVDVLCPFLPTALNKEVWYWFAKASSIWVQNCNYLIWSKSKNIWYSLQCLENLVNLS